MAVSALTHHLIKKDETRQIQTVRHAPVQISGVFFHHSSKDIYLGPTHYAAARAL